MDADHVTAWSRGGDTDLDNCEMLCVPHNRAKGNKQSNRGRKAMIIKRRPCRVQPGH